MAVRWVGQLDAFLWVAGLGGKGTARDSAVTGVTLSLAFSVCMPGCTGTIKLINKVCRDQALAGK